MFSPDIKSGDYTSILKLNLRGVSMKNILITERNIDLFNGYQGNDQKLKIGDILFLEQNDVPCVYHRKGKKNTFSIFQGKKCKHDRLTCVSEEEKKNRKEYYWLYNRYSINNADYKKSELK